MAKALFTSESVTRGHPDKICDQIADRILDEILEQDPESHVACEVACTADQVCIFGEITTDARADYEAAARRVIAEIGYTEPGRGFDAKTCRIRIDLHEQSSDIARGIRRMGAKDEELNAGAGDQGMMFGFACRQTENLMPLPIELAHSLCKKLEIVRRNGELPFLLPDGKSQVTVEYDGETPTRIAAIVVSAQHEEIEIKELRKEIYTHVILPSMPSGMVDRDTQIFINPTGRFVQGGPSADSGLTGRKPIADTYGGYARHGGGSFSGKDASKVDRSGAYMARYLAKNIVESGLAAQCEVQLSYAIGLSEPISVRVETAKTGIVPDEVICKAITDHLDLRPAAITLRFSLVDPIFSRLSCYGHFGSNAVSLPWERTDLELSL